MTKEDVEMYKKIFPQISGLYKEIGLLSKKNPNDTVNIFKLKFINRNIEDANCLLEKDKPYQDFDNFSEETCPTTSDVVMMLDQYISALERLKTRNTVSKKIRDSDWGIDVQQSFWVINGKDSDIHA